MEKIINGNNIGKFAYVNYAVCNLPVKGIVLNFMGLNDASTFDADTAEGIFYGEKDILYVTPYANPWAWMNKQTVSFVDEIIDALIEKFGLSVNVPIVSSGGSMGGLSALTYCAYAKRAPVACVANCPVCDAVFHYAERDDLPRTFYSALCQYEGTLTDALKSISPLHLASKLPAIPYRIFHCGNDTAVNINRHSAAFVSEMRKLGRDATLDIAIGREHCDIGSQLKKLYAQYILTAIEKHNV